MTIAKTNRARSVADLAEGAILATVEIAAPPERVFRALASKEIVEWWGADGVYRTTEWTGDVRAGGKWRCVGMGADGHTFAVEGEYREVEEPHRLVYTWSPTWAPGAPTLVAIRLEAIDGGTRVTVRHSGFASRESCAGHTDGWTQVLGWLLQHASPPPFKYCVVRLIPPRPTFAMDMTADERRAMGAHAAYWRGLFSERVAVAFGPVADPAGPWGFGLIAEDAEGVKRLEQGDPAVKELGMHYEILPMIQGHVRQ
jgi:uncharacterized protein YndB with AHSA1/START domain